MYGVKCLKIFTSLRWCYIWVNDIVGYSALSMFLYEFVQRRKMSKKEEEKEYTKIGINILNYQ